jgi:hypothetical protein
MFRRDFLKFSGLFSAALLTTAVPAAQVLARPVQAAFSGSLYRGTADGSIFVSADGGKTWSLHTRFGSHLSVAHLYVDLRQRLVAVLTCEGYGFRLTLAPRSRAWHTA